MTEQARLDWLREQRLGFDEAIFCLNKTVEQINAIIAAAVERDRSLLLTRLAAAKYDAITVEHQQQQLDFDSVSQTAFFGTVAAATSPARVAVVTAGTSDAAVALEAARTLRYYGETSELIYDVGVAGLWRLLERADELRQFPVVLAVAGMDAALPSVLGGLLPGAVIAVPTSTGYGVAEGGHTALRAVLASCAPGVTAVNIDNGYGAACAALRILRGGVVAMTAND